MGQYITGNRGLAYEGVQATTPPNFTVHHQDPTIQNLAGYRIGDFWLNKGTTAVPLQRLFYLASKANSIATWVLISASAAGSLTSLNPSVGGVVNPILGIINFTNADGNVVTTNAGANNLGFSLANSIVIQNNINTVNGNITIGNTVVGTTPPELIFQKSRAGGAVLAGDNIGFILFEGFNAGFTQGALISSTVTASAPGNVAADLGFWTTSIGGPLSLRLTITAGGNVIINPVLVGDALTVNGNILATAPSSDSVYITPLATNQITLKNNHLDTSGSTIVFEKTFGGAAAQAGNNLGALQFEGYDGAVFTQGAYIVSTAFAVAAGNVAANLQFWTTPVGGPLKQRMVINQAGQVQINAPDTGDGLTVVGAINAALVTGDGIHSDPATNTLTLTSNRAGGVGSTVLFEKSNTGLQVAPNDILGSLQFDGFGGAVFTQSALIRVQSVSGAVGAGFVPADMTFWTQDAGGVLRLRLTITNDGRITSTNTIDVSADNGGIAGAITFTGTADVTANGAGVFTILSKTANPLNSSGFIKIYINNVAFWIPIFSTPTP